MCSLALGARSLVALAALSERFRFQLQPANAVRYFQAEGARRRFLTGRLPRNLAVAELRGLLAVELSEIADADPSVEVRP